MADAYNALKELIIIINLEEANLLRDFIYYELVTRRKKSSNIIPDKLSVGDIVNSKWWK